MTCLALLIEILSNETYFKKCVKKSKCACFKRRPIKKIEVSKAKI